MTRPSLRAVGTVVVAALVLLATACSPKQVTVVVYAAASLQGPFATLKTQFEKEHPGVTVTLQTGGSSTLATQIVNGAPVDVFAAAGPEPMATLTEAGLSTSLDDFASNTLVLITPADNPAGITSVDQVTHPSVRTVVCQPEVPCGSLTAEVLTAKNLTLTPASLEKDVTAVLTKVRLGEADAGFVYTTDARSAGAEVTVISDPVFAQHSTAYPITVVKNSPQPAYATQFVALVRSAAGKRVLVEAGFVVP